MPAEHYHEYISSYVKNKNIKFNPDQNVYTLKPVESLSDQKDFLLVVGPTGSGKTTIVDLFIKQYGDIVERIISTTTRAPRKSDPNKTEYHYVSVPEFEAMIGQDRKNPLKLIEYIQYPDENGPYYGLTKESIHIKKIPLVNCDMRGVLALKQHAPNFNYCLIFICPEQPEQLYNQLENRCQKDELENQDKILDERYVKAQREIEEVNFANIIVINRYGENQLKKTINQLYQATLARSTPQLPNI
jgi:guanylate kinase